MKKTVLLLLLLMATIAIEAGTRPKVALVLGGGGAKGAAEIGVLKYIEKSQIPIDYIVGTSIGSIIGGLYSTGYRSAQLDSLFRSQDWLSLLTGRDISESRTIFSHDSTGTHVLGFPVGRRKNKKRKWGMMYGDSITSKFKTLTKIHDSIDFNDLQTPFKCIAVDMTTFKEVVLDKGDLPLCMRASMSIPFLYKPVEIDSMQLVDGGLLNNLPVDVARKMGADYVIAIDLTQNQHEEKETDFHYTDSNIGKIISWSLSRPDLKKYHQNVKDADIYIHPDLKGCKPSDFKPKKIEYMIKQGEYAGRKAMADLKKLKTKIQKKQK